MEDPAPASTSGPPIVPPARIGMLGGGQLGRYALMAARVMGYETAVVDPDPAAPAGRVADVHLVAAYDAPAALDELAATCAVITTEFEHPPAVALERLATTVPVRPSPAAVGIAQDRLAEKTFLREQGFPTAPFVPLVVEDDVAVVSRMLAGPAIVKSSRLGYDGKGQVPVADAARRDAVDAAWSEIGRVAAVVEQRVPLDVELSVVVARSPAGATAVYPVAENHHVDGVLDLTVVPARIDATLAFAATELATAVAEALAYVGVLAVEVFVSDGRLIVNELAPRPHNSGHWTLDAAATSQFEQQVRAICGLTLGGTDLLAPAVAMVNLLGDRWAAGAPAWSAAMADAGAHLHLYGKTDAHPGRKMGHLTVLAATVNEAAARALELRDTATAT